MVAEAQNEVLEAILAIVVQDAKGAYSGEANGSACRRLESSALKSFRIVADSREHFLWVSGFAVQGPGTAWVLVCLSEEAIDGDLQVVEGWE
jgi:hypothetical protein